MESLIERFTLECRTNKVITYKSFNFGINYIKLNISEIFTNRGGTSLN